MHILTAMDEAVIRQHGAAALRLGFYLAAAGDATLTVLAVVRHAADRQRADDLLSQALPETAPDAPAVQTRVRVGSPADEILREALEGQCDLLILGVERQAKRGPRSLDPLAQDIMARTPRPVIIVKGEAAPIRRVLLCDSGAGEASPLKQFIARLPELIGKAKEVTVLHVMSQISAGPGVRGWQLRASAEELIEHRAPEGEILESDVEILERSRLKAHAKTRHGLVVDEILEEAASGDYDLLVIGARQQEGWLKFLLDDLATQIVAGVDQPVLVVPRS